MSYTLDRHTNRWPSSSSDVGNRLDLTISLVIFTQWLLLLLRYHELASQMSLRLALEPVSFSEPLEHYRLASAEFVHLASEKLAQVYQPNQTRALFMAPRWSLKITYSAARAIAPPYQLETITGSSTGNLWLEGEPPVLNYMSWQFEPPPTKLTLHNKTMQVCGMRQSARRTTSYIKAIWDRDYVLVQFLGN